VYRRSVTQMGSNNRGEQAVVVVGVVVE